MNNHPIRDNRMIYPPIDELTQHGKFNRYELVVGTAKGARIVTDEYLEIRTAAEKMINERETDKPLFSLIDSEYRDQKPIRIAITRLQEGRYQMVREEEEPSAAAGTEGE